MDFKKLSNSITDINALNKALKTAEPRVSFWRGVKIQIEIGVDKVLVTRNSLVRLANNLEKNKKQIEKFNDRFTKLDNAANELLADKNRLTRAMVKIKQAIGNRKYHRKLLEVPESPSNTRSSSTSASDSNKTPSPTSSSQTPEPPKDKIPTPSSSSETSEPPKVKTPSPSSSSETPEPPKDKIPTPSSSSTSSRSRSTSSESPPPVKHLSSSPSHSTESSESEEEVENQGPAPSAQTPPSEVIYQDSEKEVTNDEENQKGADSHQEAGADSTLEGEAKQETDSHQRDQDELSQAMIFDVPEHKASDKAAPSNVVARKLSQRQGVVANDINKMLFALFQQNTPVAEILSKVKPEHLAEIQNNLRELVKPIINNAYTNRPIGFKTNDEKTFDNVKRGEVVPPELVKIKEDMIDYILSGRPLTYIRANESKNVFKFENAYLHFNPPVDGQEGAPAEGAAPEDRPIEEISPIENAAVKQSSAAEDIKKALFGLFQMDISLEEILRKVNPEKLIEIQNDLNGMINGLFNSNFEENKPLGYRFHRAENDTTGEIDPFELEYRKQAMINYILSGRPLNIFTLEEGYLHFNPHGTTHPTVQEDRTAAEAAQAQESTQVVEIDGEEYVLTEKDSELLAKDTLSEEDKQSIDEMVVAIKPYSYWDMATNGASAVLAAPGAVVNTVSGWVSSIASGVTNVATKGVEAVSSALGQVGSARRNFREGIDFWSILQSGYAKGVDFWNADSAEYDPLLANVINAFGKQFAKNLHFLLKNSTVLGAPKFGVKIATKFDLGVKGTSLAIDKILSLSNPLGWLSTALKLQDLGVELGTLFQNGILGEVNTYIDEFVIEKSLKNGLNRDQIEFLFLESEVGKIRSKFYAEEEKFKAQLIAQGITEAKPKEPTYNPLTYLGNKLRELQWWKDYEDTAPASYHELANELAEAKRALGEFKEAHKVKVEDITTKQALDCIKWTEIGVGLKNSSRKTLESMTKSLEASLETKKADSDEEEVEESSPISLGKNLLRNMILGKADEYNARLRIFAGHTSDLNKAGEIIKGAATTPVQFTYSRLPMKAQQVVKNFFQPVTSAVGEGIAHFVLVPNAVELIEQLQLQEPKNLFSREQLALNLSKRMGGTQYGQLLETVGGFFDFDDFLRRCLNSAGERMADRFALKLAEVLLKKTKNTNFTPEQVISMEIPLTEMQKASRKLGKAAGRVVGGVIQLASDVTSAFKNPLPPNEF
ncbi:MAG: hypothetical protein ACK5MA_05095 [Parachlamydiaceae bacterium]